MLTQNQQGDIHYFSNPVCKVTYQSLPKIYGGIPRKKNKSSSRQSLFLNLKSIQKVKGRSQSLQPKKNDFQKPMKFSLDRSLIGLTPSSNKNLSKKYKLKGESERILTQPNQKAIRKIKLKPISLTKILNDNSPDDSQSTYKVKGKTDQTLNKQRDGLMGLILQNKTVKQNKQQTIQQVSQQDISEMTQSRNITRARTQQIQFGKYDQLSGQQEYLAIQSVKKIYKTTQAQTLSESQLEREKRKNSKSKDKKQQKQEKFQQQNVKIIGTSIEIQVNLSEDAIEQMTEQLSNRLTQLRKSQTKNSPIKQRKNESKQKKLQNLRKSKFIKEDEIYSQQEQQQKQSEIQEYIKEQKQEFFYKNKQNSSRISSSQSLTSQIARGLGQNKTQFKQMIDKQLQDQYSQRSRIKSVKSNGTFRIPERKQYREYLKSYKVLDKKNFSIKQLVGSPLFTIKEQQDGVFFGQSQQQIKKGKGLYISQKQIFEGTYENDIKVKGSQRNLDGTYFGYFLNGKRQGYGKFQWNNGERFQGNWRNGVKQGFGIWKSPKGDSYEGQWKNNRQNGQGVFKHKSSIYRGQFENFLKSGKGQEQFINGDIYIGQYSDGKPDGFGKYTWYEGGKYQGTFRQGIRQGKGIWTQKNGSVYQGQFLNDCKHGKGIEIYKNGDYYQGLFIQGVEVNGILYNQNGLIKEQIFIQK